MSESVFVSSKRKLEFSNKDGHRLLIPKDYIGNLPSWVTETWLYKSACSDGTISFVGQQKSQVTVESKKHQKTQKQPELNKAE